MKDAKAFFLVTKTISKTVNCKSHKEKVEEDFPFSAQTYFITTSIIYEAGHLIHFVQNSFTDLLQINES